MTTKEEKLFWAKIRKANKEAYLRADPKKRAVIDARRLKAGLQDEAKRISYTELIREGEKLAAKTLAEDRETYVEGEPERRLKAEAIRAKAQTEKRLLDEAEKRLKAQNELLNPKNERFKTRGRVVNTINRVKHNYPSLMHEDEYDNDEYHYLNDKEMRSGCDDIPDNERAY